MTKPTLVDDPDATVAELLLAHPAVIGIFIRHKTLCVGCPISSFHTVVDTCIEYGLDEQTFRAELADAVSGGDVTRFPSMRAGARR